MDIFRFHAIFYALDLAFFVKEAMRNEANEALLAKTINIIITLVISSFQEFISVLAELYLCFISEPHLALIAFNSLFQDNISKFPWLFCGESNQLYPEEKVPKRELIIVYSIPGSFQKTGLDSSKEDYLGWKGLELFISSRFDWRCG